MIEKSLDLSEQQHKYCLDPIVNNVFTLYYLLEDILAQNNMTIFHAKNSRIKLKT